MYRASLEIFHRVDPGGEPADWTVMQVKTHFQVNPSAEAVLAALAIEDHLPCRPGKTGCVAFPTYTESKLSCHRSPCVLPMYSKCCAMNLCFAGMVTAAEPSCICIKAAPRRGHTAPAQARALCDRPPSALFCTEPVRHHPAADPQEARKVKKPRFFCSLLSTHTERE